MRFLIPRKLNGRYEKAYESFRKRLREKEVVITEKTLYSQKLKSPGSFQAEYSVLKSTITLNNGVDRNQWDF